MRYRIDDRKPIGGLVAQTYNLDAAGNIVVSKVEKSVIYDKKINKRYAEIVFTFPQVKAGSIIEYKYADESGYLSDWYFQRSIPVKLSRFTFDFPGEIELHATPYCVLPLSSKKDDKSNRNIQSFTMNNVPALRDEAFISCDNDYLQRLEIRMVALDFPGQPRVNLIRQWPGVIKSLMEDEDFGIQLKRNIPRTDDLDALLRKATSPYDKMTTIHSYVRKNMEWNGYDNIWALEGVKAAWKDKKGTSGEINLILVNLLKDAGLVAHPVLVSTRENGRVNTGVADIRQFDKVMAHVVIGEKIYVLDATEKHTPSKLIPMDIMYSEGLVISKIDTYEWGWESFWDEKQMNKNTIVISGTVTDDGNMKGEGYISSADYARVQRMPVLKEGKQKFIDKYFVSQNPGVKIDSLLFENEEVDTLPLTQKFQFTIPVNASGDYKYFSANMFSGLEKNPFIADARFSDVFFGINQAYSIIGSFNIPAGYSFEELPKNIRMIMPDTSIILTRRASVQDDNLSVRITLEFKRPFYTTDEYDDFKEFYKKLSDMLNEQFVIRKKAKP